MGNRREKHQKSSRSQLKSKNPRNEPDEVKNREKQREREMRRARSRSEDVNLNAVQLRSLTPPLDQMPGNLAIVRRVSVSSWCPSASSSKGSPSGSQSDSESESSSNADRRECTFKSKSAKSMGSSRRSRSSSSSKSRCRSRSPHWRDKMRASEETKQEQKSSVSRSSSTTTTRTTSSVKSSASSTNLSKKLLLQKAMSNRRIVIKETSSSSSEESEEEPSTSRGAGKIGKKGRNSFFAARSSSNWAKSWKRSASQSSETSRDASHCRSRSRSPRRRRSRSCTRDPCTSRSTLRSTVVRIGSPWRSSPAKSKLSNESSSRSSSRENKTWFVTNNQAEKTTSSVRNLSNPWKMEPKSQRLTAAEKANNQAEDYRNKHEISVGSNDPRPIPKPVTSFQFSGLSETIVQELQLQTFTEPTPIQAQGWPVALAGINLAIISPSGTGKTLAYLLPAIDHIMSRKPVGHKAVGPIVLVLVATRDAAVEVHKEAQVYTVRRNLRSLCLCGMGPRQMQVTSFRSSCELVIATPGRLLDILAESGSDLAYGLQRCSFMVVDSTDRMLEMGLEGQLSRIFRQLPRIAQLILASTTWSRGQERMARKFLGDYTLVRVGPTVNSNYKIHTRQRVRILDEEDKRDQLKKELTEIYDSSNDPGKVVVYAERKRRVDELVSFIQEYVPCDGIHGGRTQAERDDVIQDFRDGVYNIIVATDLTSRGLEVPGIRYVINYDFPSSIDGYVQRLARTGCSLSDGCEAISFFTVENEKHAKPLAKILEESNQYVDPRLKEWAKSNRFAGNGAAVRGALGKAAKSGKGKHKKSGANGRRTGKRGGRGAKARRNKLRQRANRNR
ncbi:uncharacterized protein Dana_GF27511 [Drosophila ananassae]|uniref:RNA helicase n=1 Tax=Drosophila ananassae TaxID=7217 RepID=A0A0P8XHC1_DROAN|nr:uncharacterized protein Dana_GF27511 [Drosophila ananassae]